MSWSEGRDSISLQIFAPVTFNEEGTGVASVGRGGLFQLAVRRGDELRQVDITLGAHGELQRSMRLAGQPLHWDAAADRWLAEFFLELDRHSAFAADRRFPALYRKGGAALVLAEVSKLGGDHARMVYLQRLIDLDPLRAETAARLVGQAAAEMKAGFALSQVLLCVARKAELKGDSRGALLAAAGKLASDFERSRVLRAVLLRPGLDERGAKEALAAARTLRSDFEKSKVLRAIAPQVSGRAMEAYLEGVRSIRSDYERSRALLAAVDGGRATSTELREMAAVAAQGHSDFEAARVLRRILDRARGDAAVRAAVVEAARRLRSDFERHKILAAAGERR